MSKVSIIAKVTCLEGKRDEAAAIFASHVEYVTANEPGTALYIMNLDSGDPNVVWFYEIYDNQDAVAAHGGSEAMKAVGGKLRGLTASRPELHFGVPTAGKGL